MKTVVTARIMQNFIKLGVHEALCARKTAVCAFLLTSDTPPRCGMKILLETPCLQPWPTPAEHLPAVARCRDTILPGAQEDDFIEPLRTVLAPEMARKICCAQNALRCPLPATQDWVCVELTARAGHGCGSGAPCGQF